MPRQPNTSSLYSPGLWNWENDLGWANNITNRGAANMQDFLTLDPSKLYGEDTQFLTELLKGRIGGGLDPALQAAQAQGRQNISRQGDTARRKTNQMQASSGFRGSGANLLNDIFGTEANALGNQSADFGLMGMQQREQAIANLLGLNSMKTGVNAGITGQQVGVAGNLANMGLNQININDQLNASKFGFDDFLGGLLGMASGSFLGGGSGELFSKLGGG